jgi:hypothetical protein
MRIPHWPALVCGLVLAATMGRSAVAAPPGATQPADSPPGKVSLSSDFGDSDDDESEPEPFSGRINLYQPVQHLGAAPGGVPENAAPEPGPGDFYGPGVTPPSAWPQESPFSQHRIQETYNSGGLWQYDSDDDFSFKNLVSVEYLYGAGLKPGNHYIGSNANHALDFFPGRLGAFPNQTTELFGNLFHNGLKANIGREYEDGSGVWLSGFILFENSEDNGLVNYHAISGELGTLRALAGIVVDKPDGTGVVLPFDTRFYQKFTQNVYGADADFYLTPFFERQTFKVKMVWGAKYLSINESFYVQGDDSGLGYVAGLATAGGGTGGGGAAGGTGGGSETITGPFTRITANPYSTVFSSSTSNNLVGPQIGLKYELGGDRFKLWGQTKFGLMADIETLTVSSSNVGAFKAPGIANTVIAGQDVNGIGFNGQLLPLPATTSKITNTHITPVIDQSIYGEFPGFAMIPWVNKWQLFKIAKMRIGWNYVYVAEVSRAAGIINYDLHGATINATHTWFEYSTVNFAVDWRF